MQLNRRDLLAQLAATLAGTTGVTTVVRCYETLDILNYTEAQLPLIEIVEPAENVEQQLVSRRQIIAVRLELRVWFVSWAEIPTSTYESLMKNIRNKMAESFTLQQKATGCWVMSIGPIQGTLPVYNFTIGLRMKYYLDETDV
jgi:hypothetical protein